MPEAIASALERKTFALMAHVADIVGKFYIQQTWRNELQPSDSETLLTRIYQTMNLSNFFGRKLVKPRQSLSDRDQANLNIKFFGYDMARRLAEALPQRPNLQPASVALQCKPTTQNDMESAWCAYWASQLDIPLFFHRKLWELAYVMQALWQEGCVAPGKSGVGFGCGREAVPSYLAAHGVRVLATDLSLTAASARGWIETGQHAGALEQLYYPNLCPRDKFEKNVSHQSVEMNAIPRDLQGFDFCWSICALEHLGSIERGLAFIERAMDCLKPGGLAVHTTEYNFSHRDFTLRRGATVLFLRSHLEEIAARLRAKGHWVAPLDFDVGSKPMDKFIDIPPFPGERGASLLEIWPENYHLKVMCAGIPATCFGLIIRRAAET